MELFYRSVGAGRPLIILHGLFGSGDNWQSLARQYAEHYTVFMVDQRNHGHSQHSPDHSYRLMADDLLAFVDQRGLQDIYLLGHSMGGKTAMLFASEHSHRVEKLIVADIAPKPYPVHHRALVDCLLSAPLVLGSTRSDVEAHLIACISDRSTVQFFMKNLYWKTKEELAWRFNLDALSTHLAAVSEETGQGICLVDTLFIRGGKSNYIADDDVQGLNHYFPNNELATISSAGHWLHAEAPGEFFERTRRFMAGF